MHPAQVLDYQEDLYSRCMQDDVERLLASHYALDAKAVIGEKLARQEGAKIASILPAAFRVASAYYVEPSMTDMILFASQGMDESDVFRTDELPTECGFAYFEKPLVIHDIRGADLFVNGLLWCTTRTMDPDTGTERPGVLITMFNDHARTPDVIAKELMSGGHKYMSYDIYRAAMGHWGCIGFEKMSNGMQIGPPLASLHPNRLADPALADIVSTEFTNIFRQLHAFWLLLNQTITDVSEADIPRPFAKRAKRAKIPPRVTVIRLRRKAHKDDGIGENNVEWAHRWYSRGHWRWQPVSEHHPLAEDDGEGGYRARIWIRGSVKGPEGLPLVISNKVYSLEK